ncbi:MAG: hypothetical protein JXB03_02100 [Spirochaetales bacterium]|nr:hypothetical protein [Spirochaetales bacterium]
MFPSVIPQKDQSALDVLLFECLPKGTQTIELSPAAPLGSCSVLAGFSQSRVLSTIRKNEVAADPTNFLALEAALRRKNTKDIMRLATSQRVLRSERVQEKGTFSHFKLFSLCIAGKDSGSRSFERLAVDELIHFYNSVIERLKGIGYRFGDAHITLSYRSADIAPFFADVIESATNNCKNVTVQAEVNEDGNWAYYKDIRLKLFISDGTQEWFIADGGDVRWMEILCNNKKERFFTSGMGTERILSVFRR